MIMDLDGPVHLTGQRGPWEYFASGTALGRLAREAASDGRFDGGRIAADRLDRLDGTAVTDGLAAGDPQAAAILDDFCREVARGIANLVLILDPQMVVLGGGVAVIGEPLREGVDRWLPELLVGSEHRPAVEIRLATLGPGAGALGAALLAHDTLTATSS
jgi:glucokinase